MTRRQVLSDAINYRLRAIVTSPRRIRIVRIRVPWSGIRLDNRRSWRITRPRPTGCGVARGIRPLVQLGFAFVVFLTTALRLRGIRVRIPTRCRKRTRTEIVALYRWRHRRRPRVTLRMLMPGVDRPVRVNQACFEVPDPFSGRTLGIFDPTDGHLQNLQNWPTRLAHVSRPQKDGRHLPDLGVRDDSRQAATRGRGRSRTKLACNRSRIGALRKPTVISGPTIAHGAPTTGIDHHPTATRRTGLLTRANEAVLREELSTDTPPRCDVEPLEEVFVPQRPRGATCRFDIVYAAKASGSGPLRGHLDLRGFRKLPKQREHLVRNDPHDVGETEIEIEGIRDGSSHLQPDNVRQSVDVWLETIEFLDLGPKVQ